MVRDLKARSNGSASEPLVNAVKMILRPLVGLLIEHGLTFPWLSNLLKSVYVDVARREFGIEGKVQTDSRINLLTGVHRKDVRRFRSEPEADGAAPENVYLGAQLVALWTGDNRFVDKNGQPIALPRLSSDEGVSFETLVTSLSKDIRPRAVLDEWLRLGVVQVDEQDLVRLKDEAFIPAKGFDEKAYYLGRNVHDHLAAARANVQSEKARFLERSVYYDNLSDNSVEILEKYSKEEAVELLKRLNKKARELQTKDRRVKSANRRMNFGIYYYSEDESSPEESDGVEDHSSNT